MSPILYKEFFTIDELRLRGIQLSKRPHALPRDSFKIVSTKISSIETDCIWYDITCVPGESAADSVRSSIIVDDIETITMRTAIPAPGAIVEEFMQYRHASDKVRYTYLGIIDVNADDCATVRCAKMSVTDSKIYEDRFHLLSPFTSLYVLAMSGNGSAMISSSTGMKNHLRIFR